jgi:fido (protein-threonine AMPylation protein)
MPKTGNTEGTRVFFTYLVHRAVYEIMWNNMEQVDRPETKIWRKRIACWIPKATNTHS